MRPARPILVLLALALLAGACAADEEPAVPTAPPTTQPPPPAGVLRLGVGPEVALDPLAADPVHAEELLVADLLADGLTALDAESGEAVPALAARWNVSASRTRWSFRLAEGAAFADGTPVTAADVVASLLRAKASDAPIADRLVVVDDVVDGGPTLVHVDLKAPLEALPELLASPNLGIVPAAVADDADDEGLSLGVGETSGPYRVVADAAEGGGDTVLHAIDEAAGVLEVWLVPLDDEEAAADAILAGAVDLARVPATVIAEGDERPDFAMLELQPTTSLYLAFNLGEERLSDPELRRAVAQTVDRQEIAEGLDVPAVPQEALVPLGAGGGGDPCGAPCATDHEAAEATFADVGPAFGLQLLIATPDDDQAKAVADAVVTSLIDVGVGAAIEVLDPEEYADAVEEGQVGVFLQPFGAVPPVREAVLEPLFRSDSPQNRTGYDVPATDAAIRAAREEQDPEARSAAWAAIERDLAPEAVLIPLVAFPARLGLSGRLTGVTLRIDGTIDLAAATAG